MLSAPDYGPNGLNGRWRLGGLFAGIWLVYLSSTLQVALRKPDLVPRVAGVGDLVAFAVLYVWSFQYVRFKNRQLEEIPTRRRQLILGAGTGLTVLECVLVGEKALVMCTFVVVLVLFLLRLRLALILTGAILAACLVLPAVVPGWQWNDGGVFIGVLTAALAMFGVTTLVQRNAQLAQARQELAQAAVAQERSRFARDLHDLLGHSLTVVTLKAELAGRLIAIDPERAEKEIAEVERLARDALVDVRAAVSGYREVSLAGELISARVALEAAGIRADLPGALDAVPGERRELFGWAVREGVTNVVRHSGAASCRIVVAGAAIEIVDDGRGPAQSPAGAGDRRCHGLLGLNERAEAVGARVSVGRAGDSGGFRLRVGW